MSWNFSFTSLTKADAKANVAKRSAESGDKYPAPQAVIDALNGALDAMGEGQGLVVIETSGHLGTSPNEISSFEIKVRQLFIEKPGD